jgi:hypothetical protein
MAQETDDEQRRRGEEAIAPQQPLDRAGGRRIRGGEHDRAGERPGSGCEGNGAVGAAREPRPRQQQERERSGQQRGERDAAAGRQEEMVKHGRTGAQVKSEADFLARARREAVRQMEAQRIAEREPLEERERKQARREPGAEDPAGAQALLRRREEDERAEHGPEEQERIAQARGQRDHEPREEESPLRTAQQEFERERHRTHAQTRRDRVLPEDDGIEPKGGREAGDQDRERASPRRELLQLRDPAHECEQRERGEQRQQTEAGVSEHAERERGERGKDGREDGVEPTVARPRMRSEAD